MSPCYSAFGVRFSGGAESSLLGPIFFFSKFDEVKLYFGTNIYSLHRIVESLPDCIAMTMTTMTTTTVGVAALPNQVFKKVHDAGSVFNMLVCGESGLGKTTFINTLFPGLKQRKGKKVSTEAVDIVRAQLTEKGFTMRFNVVDTPAFGDKVDNNRAWQPVVDFIDDQYDSYLRQEQQPFRDVRFDFRVHAVLYFIRPTAHGLKPLDIWTMKHLSQRCNLIPVISKADTLTAQELQLFKSRIRQVIEAQEIAIFTPPLDYADGAQGAAGSLDEANAPALEHARQLIESMPFAIVGSEDRYDNGSGTMVLARKYPWGLVEVENDEHCDFRKLRALLLGTYMLDLITSTEQTHYENYRRTRLEGINRDETNDSEKLASLTYKTPARKLSNNPKYKEEENALKSYFTEQVKAEEHRFRQWEQNIINERTKLNGDLEEIQAKVKRMEEEVRRLQARKH